MTSALRALVARIAASDALFRALLWGYPGLLFGYWLLAENHGVFGDEGWHLLFLLDAWQKPAGSTLRWLWNLYVFNDQYPPVFYLLSAPFFFLFDNHLVGARVYSATLAAVDLAIFYRILRLYVGRWLALLGVVVLCSSGVFVEATRYYLLEICLLMWLLAICWLVATYWRKPSPIKAIGLGVVVALGILTKPNFVIYAFPLGVLLLAAIVLRLRAAAMSPRQAAGHLALVLLPPLVLALPWYVNNFGNPDNMLATLRKARPLGELVPVYDPRVMVRFLWTSLPEFFPPFFYVAFVVVAAAVSATLVRPAGTANADPGARRRNVAAALFLGYAVYLTLLLFPLGLYYALRWNLSYAALVAALVCLLASVPWKSLRVAVCVVLVALSALYTANNFFRQFTASPLLTWSRVWYWNPRAQSTGVEEIARIVEDEERRAKAPGEGVGVAILMQAHGGVHAGAANYYLRTLGSSLKSQATGYYDNAIDVDFLTGSRYIAVPETLSDASVHPDSYRYQAVAQRWLPRHPDTFALLGRAYGRFGTFDVYKRVVPVVAASVEEDLIRIGTEFERGTAFEPFWKLARFRLAASTGHLTPELEAELDAVAAAVPSLQGRLHPPILERLKNEIAEARELAAATSGAKQSALGGKVEAGGADGFVDSVRHVSRCLLVKGWVVPADRAGPVRSVLAVRDRTVLAEVDGLADRPDVAKHFGNPALTRSGFGLCVPLDSLAPGGGDIRLVARNADGTLHEFSRRAVPPS